MNLTKSTVLFCLLVLFTTTTAFSQLKYGAKINLGTSWISSSNLKENFAFQMADDIDIKEWDVNYSPGIMAGFGAVASYTLNEKLSVQGELSFNYQQANINIEYFEDDRISGTGETETINSEAKISSSRLALPVTVHYALGTDKPVLLAGLEMNFSGTPEIESTESETVVAYDNNTITGRDMDAEAVTADLDEFKNTRLNFILGAAKAIDLGGNQLSLEVRYHLPLTSSNMYNTSNSLLFDDNTFKNNEVFGAFGKIDAEQDAPQFPLNDYKTHFLDISVVYFFN